MLTSRKEKGAETLLSFAKELIKGPKAEGLTPLIPGTTYEVL